jgi:hypothetical protein
MICLVVLMTLGGGAAEGAGEADLRVVLLHFEELLGSEGKAVGELGRHIRREVQIGSAGDAESAVAKAWLDGTPGAPPAWPAEWKGASTVVVLQVLPPAGKKPKRTSRGIGGVLVFKAGRPVPVYVERVDAQLGWPIQAEPLGKWIAGAADLGGSK